MSDQLAEAADTNLQAKPAQELAVMARNGCSAAFAELFQRYHPRLLRFLHWRLRANPAEADDIAQETFAKAWAAIRRFDDRFQFTTWLYTIAWRTAIDSKQRCQHLHLSRQHAIVDQQASVERRVQVQEQAETIWFRAQTLLSREQYAALWLRYAEELSVREIARVMNKTTVGVRVLLHRARAKLLNAVDRKL